MTEPFAPLDQEIATPEPVTIDPGARHPYTTDSFFNISAMSYGAISKPAVLAPSRGAQMAGCWLNTGEGAISPCHLEGGCDIVVQIGPAKYGVGDGRSIPLDELYPDAKTGSAFSSAAKLTTFARGDAQP